jgi:hypothetical protein
MDIPKEQSARCESYFEYWFDKMSEYLYAAKEEAYDISARYEDAKFDLNRARHFRSNARDFDVPTLEREESDLLDSKMEAERNVEWAESLIADFMLLSESEPDRIDGLSGFIDRHGIREKLGKAAYQDEFNAMLRAFNKKM